MYRFVSVRLAICVALPSIIWFWAAPPPAAAAAQVQAGSSMPPPASAPAAGDSPTTQSEPVDQLVEQLASPDWSVRERAQQRLVGIGEAAKPRLLAASRDASNPEAASRADAAIRLIEEDRQQGPSRITLHVANARAQDVFGELFRQAHAAPVLVPPDLWKSQPLAPISIDADAEPFWRVMSRLSALTGVRLRSIGPEHRPALVYGDDDDDWTGAPISICGPFVVAANRMTEIKQMALAHPGPGRSNLSIELLTEAEPKLEMLARGGRPRVIEAIDDQGRPMRLPVRDDEDDFGLVSERSRAWRSGVALFRPAPDSQRIAVLKIQTMAVIAVRTESAVFADVLHAQNVTRRVGNQELTLREVQVLRAGRGQAAQAPGGGEALYQVRLAVSRTPGPIRTPWSHSLPSVHLLDEDGKSLTLAGVDDRQGGSDIAGTVQFVLRFSSSRPTGQAGEPAQLVVDVPVETRQIPIMAEFHDLPLP